MNSSPPSLMQAGDNVRFRAISLDDFHAMGGIL
jgi:allophanate hydrolase subunit 1